MNNVCKIWKCLLAVLLLLIVVQTGSALQVTVGTATISSVGGSADIAVILDEVPNGLSGCNLRFSLSDPAIAEITGIMRPGWASPSGNTSLPGSEVTVTLGDFTKSVNPGDTAVDLGSLTIRGKQAGMTQIRVDILRMDDEKGYPLAPHVQAGWVSIGSFTSGPAPATGVTTVGTTMVPTTSMPAETPVPATTGETGSQGISGTGTPVVTQPTIPVTTGPVTTVLELPSPSPTPSPVMERVSPREEVKETRVTSQAVTTTGTPTPEITEAPGTSSPWNLVEQIIRFLKSIFSGD